MTDQVRYAKKDVYADVENEFGTPVKTKVAVEGQPVPRAYAALVDDKDTTTEIPKTRVSNLVGVGETRSTSDRRAALAERKTELTHEEARTAAAAVPGTSSGSGEGQGRKARRVADGDKARRGAQDKARSSAETKSE